MGCSSQSAPGTREQVKDQCVLLDEERIEQITKMLNYKVLVKIVEITTPLNIKWLENYPVGHHYAILVYLAGDVRKLYYKGYLKLEQLFENTRYLSYVVLHFQKSGIRGKYFNNYKELSAYYEDLHRKSIGQDLHTFKVKEGSGAENMDNTRLKNYLKDVLNKPYKCPGSLQKLFLDRWCCIDFVNGLKKKLGG